MNNLVIIILFLFLSVFNIQSQVFSVTAGSSGKTPVVETPTTGNIENIAVFYGLNGATLQFQSNTSNVLKWYRYTINYNVRTNVASTQTGNVSTVTDNLLSDNGYIVEDGEITYAIWIIDYKQYEITSIVLPSGATSCDDLLLNLTANKFGMAYYGKNSQRYPIDYVQLTYNTMKEDTQSFSFTNDVKTLSVTPTTTSAVHILGDDIPLKNTTIGLINDRFATAFGLNKSTVVTPLLNTIRVKAGAVVTQSLRNAGNELEEKKDPPYGGSAPVEMTFTGYGNEPTASFYKWEIAKDEGYTNVVYSISEKIARYTFNQFGKYYVRLTVSNTSNSCTDSTKTFLVDVVESYLKAPNAFSPNGDGKNDLFLVAYKSITRFSGWIFNRYGTELFTWNDPSKGWDGKSGGRYVIPGVYFYLIEAKGSDGVVYNLKGAVNVFSGK